MLDDVVKVDGMATAAENMRQAISSSREATEHLVSVAAMIPQACWRHRRRPSNAWNDRMCGLLAEALSDGRQMNLRLLLLPLGFL